MQILNVAEKNDAAKAISNLLSHGNVTRREGKSKFNKLYEFKYSLNGILNNMTMTSVSGHMMNLEFPFHLKNWENVDPALLFDSPVNKVCTDNMIQVKKSLEVLARNCNMLIIWTDCDREGENIGMEIVNVCRSINAHIMIKRARFSEITIQSVTRAINNLVEINLKLSQAVDVRQELDLKLGASFTRLQTLFLRKRFPHLLSDQIISYGSCQFPTLGFVVERFREVENFIGEPFWKIVLKHKKPFGSIEENESEIENEKKSNVVDFNWDRGKLFDEDLVSTILDNITDGGSLACVIDVTNKPKSKWRPFAMDTIEMEKLSSRKLKINPKKTMQFAEKLYSQGFISYPRTETNIFPTEMNLPSLVEAQTNDHRWGDFAKNLLENGINPHNGKKTDQAHPPIHPLKQGIGLEGDEARLFELITRHFLACLSQNANGHETKIFIDCVSKSNGSNIWPIQNNRRQRSGLGEGFTLTGLAVLEKNYLKVYPYDKWSDKEVPVYNIGEIFKPTNVFIESGETSPPLLLTEADLITLMDKHGIGTDATHAEHIDKVKTREYVGNTGANMSYLIPGKLGMGLVEGYDLMGFYLSRPNLRSKFEADLEQICLGNKQPQDVLNVHLNEYKTIFLEAVNQIDKLKEGVAKYLDEAPIEDNTGSEGFAFLSPGVLFEGNVRACPQCEGMVTIKSSSASVLFLGCTRYPVCKHVLWLPNTVESAVLAKCPSTGTFVECRNYHENSRNIPVHKISIKLNYIINNIFDVFPDEQRRFVLCLYCNRDACEVLNIRTQNIKPPSSQPIQRVNPSAVSNKKPIVKKQSTQPQMVSASSSLDFPKFIGLQDSMVSSAISSHGNDSGNIPNCLCGKPSVAIKVNKEGPNKGRFFYKCPVSVCNMFAWVTENESNSRSTNAPHLKTQPTNHTINASDITCKCGVQAKLLTVQKESANKGRQFYTCSQPARCGFFQWFDEAASNELVAKSNRKRSALTKSESNNGKKVFTSVENMWPPVMKDSKMSKPKSVRCCTKCKCPGHTARNCKQME